MLRQALKKMGRADLIGDSQSQLIPSRQPEPGRGYHPARRKNTTQAHKRRTGGKILTQHTGLPPRETGDSQPARAGRKKPRRRGSEN